MTGELNKARAQHAAQLSERDEALRALVAQNEALTRAHAAALASKEEAHQVAVAELQASHVKSRVRVGCGRSSM